METYYIFDTLPPDLKNKVIEDNGEINVEYNWWDHIFYEFGKDMETQWGLLVNQKEIYFSGFWSQGDGASFTGRVDLNYKLVKELTGRPSLLTTEESEFYFLIKRISNHYSHNGTMGIESYDGEFPEDKLGSFQEFEKKVLEFARNKADDLYKILSDEYDYLTSTEQVSETLRINDYVFDVDGNLTRLKPQNALWGSNTNPDSISLPAGFI